MVTCVVVVVVSVWDARDAGRVTVCIIIHSISGKLGESGRQIIVECDRQRAEVNPQVVALGVLFTSMHGLCVVVVVAYGGPCYVVTDGKFKGRCGIRYGIVVDLVLFRRGKPWGEAQWRSYAT